MPRLGVLGWPVAHSRSPAMHNAALRAAGLSDWRYQKLPVPPEVVRETIRALPAAGFRGANVTVPHKRAALEAADEATERARAIGAANTLTFGPDGAIHADNTDAPGFLAALATDPRDRTALVLGAGGSARAVVWALVHAGAREVRIWNRTPERAQALARELGATAVTGAAPADILVNTTTVGLRAEDTLAALPFGDPGDYATVVDLVYGARPTPLARAATGAFVDGLEVLVQQGALSFEIWTGRSAPIDLMRSAARDGV